MRRRSHFTRKDYIDAIHSQNWRRLRKGMLFLYGEKCQTCREKGVLVLHHKHYNTLGHEKPEDVQILCERCHAEAHTARPHLSPPGRGFTKWYVPDLFDWPWLDYSS